MKILLRICLLCFLLLVAAGAYVFWQGTLFLKTAPQNPGSEVLFDVAPGATFSSVAKKLQEKGLITDDFKFSLLARYKKLDNKLQAGRFALHTGWKPEKLLEQLISGQPILHRITIREGLPWWEVGKLLEKNGFLHYNDFVEIIKDPDFLRKYGIPFATAEGFLMPDTYLLKKEDTPTKQTAKAVVGRLIDTFWLKMKNHWPHKKIPPKSELQRLVILASIVEKETGHADERAKVAGVYANRLRIKMPLQADPTIIYGLGESFTGNLRRKHLDDPKNAYNTYQHGGLPPGPICSPGVASLQAAIAPQSHKYLYFVAITDGGKHAFSKTLAEHNRAVRQYLQNRRKKSQ